MHYPTVTQDRLLDGVFGGFFLGAGIGLAVRGGAVLDGTEIAALLISKRSTVLRVGDSILAFNVVLFVVAMAVLGVEAALYSILTYLTAARTLDFVIHGIEEYTAMTIVSGKSAEIRDAITGILGRGVTVYRGRGGLTNVEQDILYCVVTRLEIGKIKAIARGIDPAHSSCRTRSRTSKAGSSKRRRSTWTRKGAARATPRGRAFQSGCRAPAT